MTDEPKRGAAGNDAISGGMEAALTPGLSATPAAILRDRFMDPRIPKDEASWWAMREIERLTACLSKGSRPPLFFHDTKTGETKMVECEQCAARTAYAGTLDKLLRRFLDDVMPTMRALKYPMSMGLEDFETDVRDELLDEFQMGTLPTPAVVADTSKPCLGDVRENLAQGSGSAASAGADKALPASAEQCPTCGAPYTLCNVAIAEKAERLAVSTKPAQVTEEKP